MRKLKVRMGNPTVLVLAMFFALILIGYALAGLAPFLKTDALRYGLWAGITSIFAGIILYSETMFEGKKPKIKGWALFDVILSVSAVILGMLMIAQKILPLFVSKFVGVMFLLLAIRIIAEVFKK